MWVRDNFLELQAKERPALNRFGVAGSIRREAVTVGDLTPTDIMSCTLTRSIDVILGYCCSREML